MDRYITKLVFEQSINTLKGTEYHSSQRKWK